MGGELESLDTGKANTDGSYEQMIVGNAEQLVSTVMVTDRVPYSFRTSGGSADIGNREYDTLVGGTLVWNQLVNTGDTSVTVQSGHKYLAKVNSVQTVAASTGEAIAINNASEDNVFDLTLMFGSTIADYVYSLETANAGAGVAWFRKLFPAPYYAYQPGTLESGRASAHKTTGLNQYNPATGKARLLGGYQYQITGAYTALSCSTGETITPDASGRFTPAANGELTVTGGDSTTTCVHLVWSGSRDGEWEPYTEHTYPLDDTLTLRGIPKLDADNNLYFDGDTYEADGTVTRRYGIVDLGTLGWVYDSTNAVFVSNSAPGQAIAGDGVNPDWICGKYVVTTAVGASGFKNKPDKTISSQRNSASIKIKDSAYSASDLTDGHASWLEGVYLVYELATPTTESADPFQSPQIVDDWGTEEYVDADYVAGNRDFAFPQGHSTKYPANLRDKLQHLPDLAASDGDYIIRQTGTQMSLVPLPAAFPAAPAEDGTYTLKVTVSSGTAALAWVSDT